MWATATEHGLRIPASMPPALAAALIEIKAVERRILELALDQPAWGHPGSQRAGQEGLRVSPTGVRGVWVRHNLDQQR